MADIEPIQFEVLNSEALITELVGYTSDEILAVRWYYRWPDDWIVAEVDLVDSEWQPTFEFDWFTDTLWYYFDAESANLISDLRLKATWLKMNPHEAPYWDLTVKQNEGVPPFRTAEIVVAKDRPKPCPGFQIGLAKQRLGLGITYSNSNATVAMSDVRFKWGGWLGI